MIIARVFEMENVFNTNLFLGNITYLDFIVQILLLRSVAYTCYHI